jgi:hypothetical protein
VHSLDIDMDNTQSKMDYSGYVNPNLFKTTPEREQKLEQRILSPFTYSPSSSQPSVDKRVIVPATPNNTPSSSFLAPSNNNTQSLFSDPYRIPGPTIRDNATSNPGMTIAGLFHPAEKSIWDSTTNEATGKPWPTDNNKVLDWSGGLLNNNNNTNTNNNYNNNNIKNDRIIYIDDDPMSIDWRGT